MNDVIKSEALPLAMTAQVNTQVATAKQYPRNIKQIIATVTDYVTMDLETAASCTYSKPQGGKFIEGESIRLAEIMAAEWGNLAIEVGLVREEETRVICFANVWDMEKNMAHREEVSRSIKGKNGKYPAHMIETTISAGKAIARRNAIFAVIPKSYVIKLRETAQNYMEQNIGNIKEAWTALVAAFSKYSVSEQELKSVLDIGDKDNVSASHVIKATKIGVAFKDGALSRDDLFNTKKRANAMAAEPLPELKKNEANK